VFSGICNSKIQNPSNSEFRQEIEVSGVSSPSRFTFGKHWTGGHVCPRTGLDALERKKKKKEKKNSAQYMEPHLVYSLVTVMTELSHIKLHQVLIFYKCFSQP
jgi:hypothetical protein